MPKELRVKIGCLVRDTANMNDIDRINAIERFVTTELGYLNATHHISLAGLQQISLSAAVAIGSLPGDLHLEGKRIHDYPEWARTIAYVTATHQYFREQNLTPYIVAFGRPK